MVQSMGSTSVFVPGIPANCPSLASFPCLRCGADSAPNTYWGSAAASAKAREPRLWAVVKASVALTS